jgi:type III pantothenate kinase
VSAPDRAGQGEAEERAAAAGWLVIDAGNSAVKWAISDRDGHRFLGTGIEASGAAAVLDERLLGAWSGLRFRGVFATCVASAEVGRAIERAVRAACGLEVRWFGPQPHFEGRGLGHGVALLNGYRDPLQLGADRWHALIAACAKFPDQSLVVASAGTATTVDCVRAEPYAAAVFVGGVIAPGPALMRAALAQGTARLPRVEEAAAPVAHAIDSEHAIASGVHYAQLGLVENVVREFAAELERAAIEPPRLLLTGGGARALFGPLSRSVLAERAVSALSLEQHLVLRGIALRAHAEQAAAAAGARQPAE